MISSSFVSFQFRQQMAAVVIQCMSMSILTSGVLISARKCQGNEEELTFGRNYRDSYSLMFSKALSVSRIWEREI